LSAQNCGESVTDPISSIGKIYGEVRERKGEETEPGARIIRHSTTYDSI